MKTDLFDFDLPPERIALRPVSPRDAARLLVEPQPDGRAARHSLDARHAESCGEKSRRGVATRMIDRCENPSRGDAAEDRDHAHHDHQFDERIAGARGGPRAKTTPAIRP